MNHDAHPVRAANRADLDALLALEEATFTSDRIRRRQWLRHLDNSSATVLVCGQPGEIAAAAVVFYRRHARAARLYSLAVRADQRGKGFADSLLAAAEADARARACAVMRLEVQTGNAAAIALYQRHGYRCMQRLPRYYEDGADAWRYAKVLTTVTC